MEQAGFEDADAVPRVLAIWEKYVSEKPRPGYRPLGLSYRSQGLHRKTYLHKPGSRRPDKSGPGLKQI